MKPEASAPLDKSPSIDPAILDKIAGRGGLLNLSTAIPENPSKPSITTTWTVEHSGLAVEHSGQTVERSGQSRLSKPKRASKYLGDYIFQTLKPFFIKLLNKTGKTIKTPAAPISFQEFILGSAQVVPILSQPRLHRWHHVILTLLGGTYAHRHDMLAWPTRLC